MNYTISIWHTSFLFSGITYSCKPEAIICTNSLRLKVDDVFCKVQGKEVLKYIEQSICWPSIFVLILLYKKYFLEKKDILDLIFFSFDYWWIIMIQDKFDVMDFPIWQFLKNFELKILHFSSKGYEKIKKCQKITSAFDSNLASQLKWLLKNSDNTFL